MSLKDSIIVVNEFTNKNVKHIVNNKVKTHGKSPGNYIMKYIARTGAIETVAPVQYDTEDYIMRYMSRADAVDALLELPSNVPNDIKESFRNMQGAGGVAFGDGDFSLSHKRLKEISKDIQKQYDKGKTVMKTIITFRKNYLLEHGIIDEDLYPEYDDVSMPEGAYRGNIDQLKLRLAIMSGIEKMSRNYDDLQYVGTIQVDTNNVHCHLAMVDRGKGSLASDGTQRGKLNMKTMNDLRRGIDIFLDQSKSVKKMFSDVSHDKRNTVCFIKKYTHKSMNDRGFSQFLLACLPEDRNLWRASTNRKEMKKANSIVREYVSRLLELPDSGYQKALEKVDIYAKARMKHEGLSGKEYRMLYNAGKNEIINASINSVYAILKQIPETELDMRTPMLDAMSLPYDEMVSEVNESNPMVEFGFKLRSYKTRLDHHKKEYHKYHDAVKDYEKLRDSGQANQASVALYEFLKIEEEYNEMLLSKYNHFLKFIPPSTEYMEEFDKLMLMDRRIQNLIRMQDDQSLRRMSPENAEESALLIYGETGGDTLVSNPSVIENRISYLRKEYAEGKEEFLVKLADYGMSLTDDNKISRKTKYDFEDVKALDLHHLLYDFPYDVPISVGNSNAFVEMADRRYRSFQMAKQYLIMSGQEEQLSELPETDIELQYSTASRFRGDVTLHTQRVSEEKKKRRKPIRTVSIDYDFYVTQEEEIKNMIKNTINSLQYE